MLVGSQRPSSGLFSQEAVRQWPRPRGEPPHPNPPPDCAPASRAVTAAAPRGLPVVCPGPSPPPHAGLESGSPGPVGGPAASDSGERPPSWSGNARPAPHSPHCSLAGSIDPQPQLALRLRHACLPRGHPGLSPQSWLPHENRCPWRSCITGRAAEEPLEALCPSTSSPHV